MFYLIVRLLALHNYCCVVFQPFFLFFYLPVFLSVYLFVLHLLSIYFCLPHFGFCRFVFFLIFLLIGFYGQFVLVVSGGCNGVKILCLRSGSKSPEIPIIQPICFNHPLTNKKNAEKKLNLLRRLHLRMNPAKNCMICARRLFLVE